MQRTQDIAEAFSIWEERLRGWYVYPYKVELEPPFIPIYAYLESPKPGIDDGKQETVLSELSNSVKGLFKPKKDSDFIDNEIDDEIDDAPDYFSVPDENYCSFQIALPTDHTGSLVTYKNFLQSLRYSNRHLSFEIIGSSNRVVVQLSSWQSDSEKLLQQIRAHLPTATVTENTDAINGDTFSDQTLVVDFALEHEVMYSLQRISDLKHDPLTALIGGMDMLHDQEQCIFQILFKHTNQSWATHLRDSVIDIEGKPLFMDGAQLVTSVKEKTSTPLYACVIRLAIIAESESRRLEIARSIGGTLAQYDSAAPNNLMPLNNENYDTYDHWRDVVERTTHRCGMLLSLDELIGFLHYPDEIVKSDKLSRQRIKTKAAPELAVGHELVLGLNEHRGVTKEVSLSAEQRSRHMYVVGSSGTGKSTLFLNCIKQDIEAGEGLCVIDPHGDLIDQTLSFIPDDRFNDVILLDPSDEKFPIGFNILHAHSNLEKTLLASDLAAVFERLATTWGDQMNAVLSNGILAFLESEVGGTLLDLRRFLVEQDFRHEFLETVLDDEVIYFWKKEFPMLSGRPQAPVLTRLNTFLRPKPIRHMVAQKQSAIDFADVMDNGKILLAKLSHGGIGEENAYLLGALIASKIHQTALSRQAMSQEQRRFFWLYIDEFQNFVVPSIDQTLSGARKYHLGMILAHQELTQLSIQNKAIAASVIANPYSRICFRMGDRDARVLSEGFSEFDSKDLQSLGIGEAIGRIEQANYDFSLNTYPLPEIDQEIAQYKTEAIRKVSRQRYAKPLSQIEEILNRSRSESDSDMQVPIKQEDRKEEKESKKAISVTKSKGKGGDRHKEIQSQLQQAAHAKGLSAVIEKHIGKGQHIDILINTGQDEIAFEISISTSVEHEIGNIKKCIDAGFKTIWCISDDQNHLNQMKDKVQESFDVSNHKIKFYSVDQALKVINDFNIKTDTQIVRGYELHQSWQEIEQSEKNRRETAFSKVFDSI